MEVYKVGHFFSSETSTDASGHYVQGGLPAGDFKVIVRSPQHVDELWEDIPCEACTLESGTPVPVTLGVVTSGIDFELVLGGVISGRVSDAATDSPWAD